MKRIRLHEQHPTPDRFRAKSTAELDEWLSCQPTDDDKWLMTGICDAAAPRRQEDITKDVRELQISHEDNAIDHTPDSCTKTPELCSCAIGTDATEASSSQQPRPLFSLFRPAIQRKVLVVIRHGESEYNAASRSANGWQDPKIFDPALTAKGCRQACALRAQLARELKTNPSLQGHASFLWVTSPLRRCLQTFALSCPALPPSACEAAEASGRTAAAMAAKLAAMKGQALPRLKIVTHIAERVLTYGDVGTPAAELRGEFSALHGCFGDVPEGSWWYGGAKNCKATGTFVEKETSAAFKERLAAAKRWIERQPEKVVFMYGHSVFWKTFFAHTESLANCEYRIIHW